MLQAAADRLRSPRVRATPFVPSQACFCSSRQALRGRSTKRNICGYYDVIITVTVLHIPEEVERRTLRKREFRPSVRHGMIQVSLACALAATDGSALERPSLFLRVSFARLLWRRSLARHFRQRHTPSHPATRLQSLVYKLARYSARWRAGSTCYQQNFYRSPPLIAGLKLRSLQHGYINFSGEMTHVITPLQRRLMPQTITHSFYSVCRSALRSVPRSIEHWPPIGRRPLAAFNFRSVF